MAFYNNVIAGAAGAGGAAAEFKIERSLRFDSTASSYLSRTPSSAGNRRTWTWSSWVKRGSSTANNPVVFSADTNNGPWTAWQFTQSTGTIQVTTQAGVNPGLYTNSAFRDFSAWYHIVIAMDTTQATAANRVKLYVNGVQQTFSNTNYPSQNYETKVNGTYTHHIGYTNNQYFDGLLAEVHLVDGQALAPTDFGEIDATTGAWNPIEFTGNHGTNGFHLDFKNNSSNAALGYDAAGSNNWTVNNIIADPGLATAKQGMDVVTYTGNGTARNIGGLEFEPDLIIVKSRNASYNHYWVDRVRGINENLYSNSNEATQTADRLSSFRSDGFGLTNHTGVNNNGTTYVAWCWKAGGTATTNTTGTRQSSVSANNTYGFSITTWTGDGGSSTTVGHGLTSAPDWVIIKNRDGASSWHVYARAVDSTGRYGLYLNGDNSKVDFTNPFFDADNNTINLYSASVGINGNGTDYVAWSWTEIPGFSKFGTYAGTGSAHTVNLGFRPRYLIYKSATASSTNWHVFDTARNNGGTRMLPNLSNGDSGPSADAYAPTFTDTGFTVAAVSDTHTNASGHTYFYAAFADKPDQSIIDSLIDSPQSYEADSGNNGGNYCVFNPLSKDDSIYYTENGNLVTGNNSVSSSSSGSRGRILSSIGFKTGKWYAEVQTTAASDGDVDFAVGIFPVESTGYSSTSGHYALRPTGHLYSPAGTYQSYGTGAWTDDDIIGIAVDMDSSTKTIQFFKNGTAIASATTIVDNEYFFGYGSDGGGGGRAYKSTWNFGQRPFAYTPPTGHKSLCTQNLPNPIVNVPATAFDVRSGLSAQFTINDLGFEPGLVWAKSTSNAEYWIVADKLRNFVGGLRFNGTNAEGSADAISSVGATGYQSNSNWFTTGRTYATFNWNAGSSNTSISAGSLNSSAYDQRTTWTNGLTADDRSFNSSYPATQFFDGNKTTFASTGGSGGGDSSGTVDLGNYFPSSNGPYRVEVGCTSANATVTIGGVEHDTADPSNNAIRIWTSVASVPSIVMDNQGAFGGSHIIINGKLLVDSGVSVANVPSNASTVRANQTTGFSIVTYNGTGSNATFGHGLNAAPELVIIKSRSHTQNWAVYSAYASGAATPSEEYAYLNSNNGFSSTGAGAFWNNTSPTSSVVSVGTDNDTNASGKTYVAYCFAPVEGYSAFGNFSSGSDPFVFTGFSPRFVLLKRTDSAGHWYLFDSERQPNNYNESWLEVNGDSAEQTHANGRIELLSNGFRVIGSDVDPGSGTMLYAVFAQHPFKHARAK